MPIPAKLPESEHPDRHRKAALGGAAITTMMALLVADPHRGVVPNLVFVSGMAAVGAMTGMAMSVRNG